MNNIRKFGIIAALLAVVTILVPLPARLDTAFASETASDAIIQEARNEAEKLLAVRSAVWLKFLDEWNAYLEERKSDPDLPAPVFSSFIPLDGKGLLRLDVLLDKEGAPGYLPASFPVVNYKAVSLGNEIEVAVTLSNVVSAKYVPNFLPMAEVSEGTVKLRITRPGATPKFSFFVEKNAANEMGSAGTLEWVDGQGKIAVNELESNIIRSQAGEDGKIDFKSTVVFGTIEGRDGADISVANTLNLGNNTLKTTGAGEFGTLSAADDKFTVDSITGDIETTGGLSAAGSKFTVNSSTGDITTKGGLSAAGDKFTVDSSTGDITTKGGLSAAGDKFTVDSSTGAINTTGRVTTGSLTIDGKTGTESDAYKVWVENANKATNATNASNADTLAGQTLAQVKAKVTSLDDGSSGKTWGDIKGYIDDKDAEIAASGGSGYKTIITVPANYTTRAWAGTWAQFCTLAGLPSNTTIAIMVMVPTASSEYIEGENSGRTIHHFEYIPKLYTKDTLYSGEDRNIKGKIVVPTNITDFTVYPTVGRKAYIVK